MIRTVLIAGLLLALGVVSGWTLRRAPSAPAPTPVLTARRCPMHPWITAPGPGRCTVCGMNLGRAGDPVPEVCGRPAVVTLGPAIAAVIGVQTAPVARQPLERTLRVAGAIQVDGTRRRYLTAWTDGRIDRLFVNSVGTEIRAGEPLLALYSRNLLAAQQELLLLARAGENSAAALAEQRLQMMQLGFTHGQLQELLEHREPSSTPVIMAPHGGTVLANDVMEGQWVRTGDRLFEIADLSRLWFVFEVPAGDREWLRAGQEVRISSDGAVFSAPVTFVDPNLNPATGAARARAEFDSRPGLTPGLLAEGRVTAGAPAVLTVPRSAVLDSGAGPLVWIDRGGAAYELRALQLDRRGDTLVEVLAGLIEGEQVVVQGALLIDAQAQLTREPPR